MKDAHTWNRTRVTKATIWCTATVLCELLVLSLLHSLFSLPLIHPSSTDSIPPHKVAAWTPPGIPLFCSKILPSPPSTHFSNQFYSLAFPLHRSWSRLTGSSYPSHRVPLLGLLYDSSSRGGLLLMPPWVSWVRPKTDRTSSTDSPRFYI